MRADDQAAAAGSAGALLEKTEKTMNAIRKGVAGLSEIADRLKLAQGEAMKHLLSVADTSKAYLLQKESAEVQFMLEQAQQVELQSMDLQAKSTQLTEKWRSKVRSRRSVLSSTFGMFS